jgi:uncharacterized MnhB-related membrane protein
LSQRVQAYLKSLRRQLWLRGVFDAESLAEVESHLLEAVEAGVRHGLSVEDSERQALERFGSVKVVSLAFENERKNLMQHILLAVAVLAGLFSAYVDSRPTWDDTGVLAFGILLVCGLLTVLGHRRPWLIALAVGIWIPLNAILFTHVYAAVVALAFAFVGAYGGWLVNLGIRKTLHPA